MSFRIEFTRHLREQIASWQLSDFLLVEVHLRLRHDLSDQPALTLQRHRHPFDGMCYSFSMIDPENRLREHLFVFHVLYSQDEQSIFVARGATGVGTIDSHGLPSDPPTLPHSRAGYR